MGVFEFDDKNERLLQYFNSKGISLKDLNLFLKDIEKDGKREVSYEALRKFFKKQMNLKVSTIIYVLQPFNDYNLDYILKNEGEMIKMEGRLLDRNHIVREARSEYERKTTSNLIPFYDDVSSIGGNGTTDIAPISTPTEYIETGTWFGNVKITAAIRHYGESMIEYPNGCILALKEIADFDNVVWGRNYVIETDEIRVTKRIQSAEHPEYVSAYSTNNEVYPDGRQIHEPFRIKRSKIARIFLVVGRIVKENGAGSLVKI